MTEVFASYAPSWSVPAISVDSDCSKNVAVRVISGRAQHSSDLWTDSKYPFGEARSPEASVY